MTPSPRSRRGPGGGTTGAVPGRVQTTPAPRAARAAAPASTIRAAATFRSVQTPRSDGGCRAKLPRGWVSASGDDSGPCRYRVLGDTVMTAHQRPSPTEGRYPPATEARVNRRAWARVSRNAGQTPRRQAAWSNEEILAVLQDWATQHGRPPNSCEWIAGSPDRPSSICVRRRFGSWEHALKRAGLKPNTRRQGRYWTNAEILNALKTWTRRHGRPPKATDWTRAHRGHPCTRSVTQRYGSFKAALAAAKLA